jgi:excinuclease UvrABC nuclease subunit
MNMCLRPCQQVVGIEEYASEAARVAEFFDNSGRHLLQAAEAARTRLSEEMDFEGAARQHKRVEKIEQVIGLRDELVCDLDRLCGIAVARSAEPESVSLWFVWKGVWQSVRSFPVGASGGQVSMDARLKDMVREFLGSEPIAVHGLERQEHIALLARWFYSSWRDGEWIPIESPEKIPYRRLVGAVSRVAAKR